MSATLSLHKGDIVFARYPREETPEIKSSRPCLVLAVLPLESKIIGAKLTTTLLPRAWSYSLNAGEADMRSGRLQYDSWINLRRREEIPFLDIEKNLCSLKFEVFNAVLKQIENLLA